METDPTLEHLTNSGRRKDRRSSQPLSLIDNSNTGFVMMVWCYFLSLATLSDLWVKPVSTPESKSVSGEMGKERFWPHDMYYKI